MTIIEAITILEIATVECRSKDVDTPAVNQALNFVELYVRPEWVVPQFSLSSAAIRKQRDRHSGSTGDSKRNVLYH